MANRKLILGSLAGLLVVAGSGAYALAASNGSTSGTFNFISDLASHLGLSAATVKSAVQQTEIDRVNALLKAGKITQQQATTMEQAIQSGKPGFGGMGFMMHRHGPMGMGMDMQAVATYLGVTPQQLMTDLGNGQTLAQIATAQGKTVQGLEQAMTTAFQTRLQSGVSAGRISQQQANQMLSRYQSRLSQMVQNKMPAMGGPGGDWGPPAGGMGSGGL